MKASEIRARARTKLGENRGWFTAVVGNFLSILVTNAVNGTARAFLGLGPLIALMQRVQQGEAGQEELLQALPGSLAGISAAMLIAFYLSAVFAFGMSSLSIAVMRGGAKIGHVFAGFGKGISLLWLWGVMQTYVFLWSLLFIIPGIRAAFSYALMYYVRADHPDWGANQCLAESKRLMHGHRWRLFCLMFSFVGWFVLGVLTIGIAMLWVLPYFQTALAAFYEDLLDRDSANGNEFDIHK